jgi:predicted ABC-type transport system involved in lysophospholipase L1 biosynthesis ATPase subunit
LSQAPVISVRQVVKSYQALRPLRVDSFDLTERAVVSVMGLDAGAAEMFVGLLTGAMLPDAGDIHLFGTSTKDVANSDAWLAMLDAVGIVTDRAVLIAQFSAEQNIALPLTLQVDPMAQDTRARVADLAAEVGIATSDLAHPVAQSSPGVVARVRLARAFALSPRLLLAEHPSASLPREQVKAYAVDIARVARLRSTAVLALTADETFANALGGQVLTLEPATGVLRPRSVWRKLFG